VINSSQVTVISGETGCGKTTQVSYWLHQKVSMYNSYILKCNDMISNPEDERIWGGGDRCFCHAWM